METGRRSPIVEALANIETLSHCEVQVFLSQRRYDRTFSVNSSRIASLFAEVSENPLTRPPRILFYLNLSVRKFVIIYDRALNTSFSPDSWRVLSQELSENLRSTQYERAIALTLHSLGQTLQKQLPKKQLPQKQRQKDKYAP